MTTPHEALLEINVHLEDGRVTKFRQDDPVLAKRLLDNLQPTRLFAQKV